MHSKKGNIKFTSCNDASKVVAELFDSFCLRYHGNLETSIRGSNYNFDSVQLMYYKCHKVNFPLSRSQAQRKKEEGLALSQQPNSVKMPQLQKRQTVQYFKSIGTKMITVE